MFQLFLPFPKAHQRLLLCGLIGFVIPIGTRSPEAAAATISYAANNLADTTPGEDLWEYHFLVSGVEFDVGQGFTIFFDRTLYTQLQSPPPTVSEEWDALTIQPDLLLQSDGFYDALALQDAPSLLIAFAVTFVWFGAADPGEQNFTLYNTDFSTREQGQTSPDTDTDGDGCYDIAEIRAGTDPTDPNSHLTLSFGASTAAGLALQFETVAGRIYRIEYSVGLHADSWTVLAEDIPGDGDPATIIDADASTESRRFYRVDVMPGS